MGLRPADHQSHSNIPILPAGAHAAITIQVIDLGTHYDEAFGKHNRKVRITWELPEERHVFKEEKGEEPRITSKTYNFSGHEKSNFMKDMVSWHGGSVPEEFDIESLLMAPAMVNVTHDKKNNGKVYANVSTIMPLPKMMRNALPKETHNPVFYYTVEDRDTNFDKLPDFLKEQVKACEEFKPEKKKDGDESPFDNSSNDLNGEEN